MVLEVARIKARLAGDDEGVCHKLREHNRLFLAHPPADFTLEVTAGPRPAQSRDEAGLVRCRDGSVVAQFDFRTMRGVVSAPADRLVPTVLGFLSTVYAHLLLREGGLMLHAAVLAHEGVATLLVGPSGAGKTTAARLSAPATVLHDDLALLRADQTGDWHVYPAPAWTGEIHNAPPRAPLALAGVFFLVKGRDAAVRRLPPAQAAARLLVAPAGLTERALWHNLLASCEALARAVAAFELRFPPGVALWPLVAAAQEATQ